MIVYHENCNYFTLDFLYLVSILILKTFTYISQFLYFVVNLNFNDGIEAKSVIINGISSHCFNSAFLDIFVCDFMSSCIFTYDFHASCTITSNGFVSFV